MPDAVPDQRTPRTPARHDGYAPIEDYAAIGNKRNAGLVALDGSIDWLCLPRFDAPSVFGALLDPDRGGTWTLQPREAFRVTRRYVEQSNVLETTFETERGTVRVTDAITHAPTRPIDWDEVVRRVECVRGEVAMRWRVEPRFEFKSLHPEVTAEGDAHVLRSGRRSHAAAAAPRRKRSWTSWSDSRTTSGCMRRSSIRKRARCSATSRRRSRTCR